MSEIRTRISRQGWRVIDQHPDSAHPSIDHRKRRVHAATGLELAQAYLQLRGWHPPADWAGEVAHARALNNWLQADEAAETAPYPLTTSDAQAIILDWVQEDRADILPEISRCHESHDHSQQLAERVRSLAARPELVLDVPVTHSFKVC